MKNLVFILACFGAFSSVAQTTSNRVNPNWGAGGHWTGSAPKHDMERSATLDHNSSVTSEIKLNGYTLIVNVGDTLTLSQNLTINSGGKVYVNGHIEGTSGSKELKVESSGVFEVSSTGSVQWDGKVTTDDNPNSLVMDGVMRIGGDWSNKQTWTGSGRIDVDGTLNNDGGNLFGCTSSGDNCCGCATCCLPSSTTIGGLPIELTSFIVNMNDNGAHLEWQTASEVNNQYFVVERLLESGNWTALGQVQSMGTSNEFRFYEYDDYTVNPYKDAFYRLSQVDNDGNSETFNVIKAAALNVQDHNFEVIKTNERIELTFNDMHAGLTEIILIDAFGNVLEKEFIEDALKGTKVSFELTNYPSGWYMLGISGGSDFHFEKMIHVN